MAARRPHARPEADRLRLAELLERLAADLFSDPTHEPARADAPSRPQARP